LSAPDVHLADGLSRKLKFPSESCRNPRRFQRCLAARPAVQHHSPLYSPRHLARPGNAEPPARQERLPLGTLGPSPARTLPLAHALHFSVTGAAWGLVLKNRPPGGYRADV
jgi:hypothetical protein